MAVQCEEEKVARFQRHVCANLPTTADGAGASRDATADAWTALPRRTTAGPTTPWYGCARVPAWFGGVICSSTP